MTPNEFKAWFEGYSEAIEGAPTKEQWERIRAQVAGLSHARKPFVDYRRKGPLDDIHRDPTTPPERGIFINNGDGTYRVFPEDVPVKPDYTAPLTGDNPNQFKAATTSECPFEEVNRYADTTFHHPV